MNQHRQHRRGFLLVTMMFVLSGVLAMTVAGLTRSFTDLNASTRVIGTSQAFQLAEAGVDRALTNPIIYGKPNTVFDGTVTFTAAEINTLLNGANGHGDGINGQCDPNAPNSDDGQLSVAGNPGYTLRLIDNADADASLCVDTDNMVILVATGNSGAMSQTVRVTLELPGGAVSRGPFDYAAAAGRISLSGSAKLGYDAGLGGNGAGRVPLYVGADNDNGYLGIEPLHTVSSSQVWVSRVDFFNPYNQPLNDPQQCKVGNCLCPACYDRNLNVAWGDPTVFPPSRASETKEAPVYKTSGVSALPPVEVNLQAYYDKSIQQCLAEDPTHTQTQCTAGTAANSYHHIAANTTIDGGKNGITIEGIMYVELGVEVTLKGKVTINGTIVHEGGGGWDHSLTSGPNLILTIDSYSDTHINGVTEPAFAPGAAIVGAPHVGFQNSAQFGDGSLTNPGIKGFLMMTGNTLAGTSSPSIISASGTIQGGIIEVSGVPGLRAGEPGPGSPSTFLYPIGHNNIELGGSANVMFQPLPGAVNGLPQTGGGGNSLTRPAIRSWSFG